jgi:hypothetical protein
MWQLCDIVVREGCGQDTLMGVGREWGEFVKFCDRLSLNLHPGPRLVICFVLLPVMNSVTLLVPTVESLRFLLNTVQR